VPADARLLDGDQVEVDQSALTGESLPVTRNPGEAVFSGSIIRQGEIDALVYATGAKTYFGKTTELVQEAHTVSHFQRAVLKIGTYLIYLAVALVAVIVAVSLFRGNQILTTLQFALVLTVAAIPVAMPTVLSVTMSVGAHLLAKKQAIVTRLATIEELEGLFDDHPSLDASLQDFEPGSSEIGQSPRYGYPSHHSGFRSDTESEMADSASGGRFSPPAWRRDGNGNRSSGFWNKRRTTLGKRSREESRDSSP